VCFLFLIAEVRIEPWEEDGQSLWHRPKVILPRQPSPAITARAKQFRGPGRAFLRPATTMRSTFLGGAKGGALYRRLSRQ